MKIKVYIDKIIDRFGKKKFIAGLCLLAVIILVVVLLIISSGKSSDDSDAQYEEYEVQKSEMVKTLTAAGEITAAESADIEFSTSKTFKAMCVEENEIVSSGQNLILYGDGTYETAPCDGLIKSINAPETGSVGTSENLISFGKTDTLTLEVTVPEDQIGEISKGDNATIVAGADDTKKYTGKITGKREMSTTLISEKEAETEIEADAGESTDSTTQEESSQTETSDPEGASSAAPSGSTDPFGSESGTAYYTVVVKFKNDGTLKPGMSASCTVTISERDNVVTVPVEAVYYNKKDNAYVIMSNGKEKRQVKTGESDATNVEITEGLEVGEKIQVESQK